MLNEYKKENFGLKLRIYHLEEALRKRWGEKDDGWKMVSRFIFLLYVMEPWTALCGLCSQ